MPYYEFASASVLSVWQRVCIALIINLLASNGQQLLEANIQQPYRSVMPTPDSFGVFVGFGR